MRSIQELEKLALKLRKKWGEDDYSPVDVFALSLLCDSLTIVKMTMPEIMSGMCIKSDQEIIISINSKMSLGRQRFTLAHELYHAFYDDEMTTYICQKKESGLGSEKEADTFASYFLMPDLALDFFRESKGYSKWDLESIMAAEQFFGISHVAMLFRLLRDGQITTSEYEELGAISVSRVAYYLGYSTKLYLASKEDEQYGCNGNYIRKVNEAYERGLIGEGKRDELLLDAFVSEGFETGGVLVDD